MSFIKQYLLHPRQVGAVKPSSKYLAKKMLHHVSFDRAQAIAEFGPGTGVFTKEIVQAKRDETLFLIFEVNDSFYEKLEKKYKNAQNVHVIHDSAENIGIYLKKYNLLKVDYIISGLPFASLPGEVSDSILKESRKYLSPRGLFITFQYTLLKKKLFQRFFKIAAIEKERRNIPPAYVLNCRKVAKKKVQKASL